MIFLYYALHDFKQHYFNQFTKKEQLSTNISYFFFSFLITMLISLSIHLHCPIAVILLQNSIKSKDIICISNHTVETHLYFSFSFPSSFPIILLLFLFINCPTHRDESDECISASFNAAFQWYSLLGAITSFS